MEELEKKLLEIRDEIDEVKKINEILGKEFDILQIFDKVNKEVKK